MSFDSIIENAAFAQKFQLPFPLLCDTNRTIGMAYGACETAGDKSARRITYVIDPEGRIVQVFAKVNAATHPQELLSAV